MARTTKKHGIGDLQWVDPRTLDANPANWRIHPPEQVAALEAAVGKVGWVVPLIWNERTKRLIDGHARRDIAIERGDVVVPVIVGSWPEDEERAILASLDPISAMAGADADLLQQLLEDFKGDPFGEVVPWERLYDLRPGDVEPKEGETDPDAAPAIVGVTITKPGDVWRLGDHRVACGDASDPFCVEAAFGVGQTGDNTLVGPQAQLVWTDPPYGLSYHGKTPESLTIENDEPAGLGDLLQGVFRAVPGSPGSGFYVCCPHGPVAMTFLQALVEAGWRLHEQLVWVKDSMVLGHSDYHSRHEAILYGWLPGPGRSGRGRHQGSRWFGDNSQTTVFEVPRPRASREHPTMKPTALIEPMLQNSSRPGETVYDPFLGSGSTLLACERLQRRCVGIELDPRYVDVVVKRWEDFTGQKAERT